MWQVTTALQPQTAYIYYYNERYYLAKGLFIPIINNNTVHLIIVYLCFYHSAFAAAHSPLWLVALFEPLLCNDSFELFLKAFVNEMGDTLDP